MEFEKAPDFTLPDKDGKNISLKDFKGKWVILYFYPKDNTSGCTREAVEFSEKLKDFKDLNAEIIGVSKDSEKSHQKFYEKHNLKITLLSDVDHKIHELYGAWGKKKLYGKEYMGTIRSTFLIDPDGFIRKEWKKVKVKGHVEEVLNTLKREIDKT